MILFLYNLALFVALILGSPWWLFRMATTSKYREGFFSRIGFGIKRPKSQKPILWLHAVSVGEVLAVARLIQRLDESFPNYPLLISTTTRTGQALARARFGVERVFYAPLDLPWAVANTLNSLQPALLILAETEFWPNLLSACAHRKIPVAVVNARISDRSWPRYLKLRSLWRQFLAPLSLVLAQTETDASRLRAIGCTPTAVYVSGNLKFDVRSANQTEALNRLKPIASGKKVLVAGSTLEGEEALLITAWQTLRTQFGPENCLLILAPRHPERFAVVAALLEKSGLAFERRSAWPHLSTSPSDQEQTPGASGIVLLDTIGELASLYQLATVSFVGGSLVPSGGHNPLEPAQFARPILMGPSFENFRGIVEPMLASNAIRIVALDDLSAAIATLFADPEAASTLGQRAYEFFQSQSGTTERTVEALQNLLTKLAVANETGGQS